MFSLINKGVNQLKFIGWDIESQITSTHPQWYFLHAGLLQDIEGFIIDKLYSEKEINKISESMNFSILDIAIFEMVDREKSIKEIKSVGSASLVKSKKSCSGMYHLDTGVDTTEEEFDQVFKSLCDIGFIVGNDDNAILLNNRPSWSFLHKKIFNESGVVINRGFEFYDLSLFITEVNGIIKGSCRFQV
jgi:hypothetical protein